MSDNKGFTLSNRLFAVVVVLAVGMLIVWSFQVWQIVQGSTGSYPREITVEGKGSAFVVPDIAQLNVGLQTKGKTAAEVVEENTKKVNAIIAAVKEAGVEEADIQTTSYYLNPNQVWNPSTQTYTDEGFILDQSVQVKIRDLNATGEVVSAATNAGANSVGGVQFTIEDMDAALEAAREEAIANAKVKAEQISEQAGLDLGRLLNFYEYQDGYYDPYYGKGGVMMDAAVSESSVSAVPSIEPGQQEVKLTVSLTYRIK